ncbi:hypothetical protein [Leisingera sp. M658]|uniref:hypothetical protein n=1 Tax=Leisingera sp. M658 TaxID=2867015 RepID=UPI0021A6E8B9|nr:hypothetical protein [Leisingera sp. M658]UWQ77378.1 hypothetical protein K3724_22850 [Leisingera sp. M658]
MKSARYDVGMMRQDFDYWSALMAATECKQTLANKGIALHVTVDETEVSASVERIGKPYLTPWLDPKKNDFTPENYFWLIASRDGVPLIVGGGRLDVVGSNAAGHMFRAFSRGYGEGVVTGVSPEISSQLSGRICYLGDLFSKSGEGLGAPHRRLYLGVANYIASQHFGADYTYSFMRMRDVTRGSADLNGLDRRIYNPVRWGRVPEGRNESEVIVFREARHDIGYFDSLMQELAPHVPVPKAVRDDHEQAAPA